VFLAPSILSADFANLGRDIDMAVNAGAHWIHLDVMDGHFVPNITMGPPVIRALRKVTDVPFDAHLMISDPDRFLEDFVKAGVNWITVHVEGAIHLDRTLNRIRQLGVSSGVAVNPATPLAMIEGILELVDMVLLMSVNPGFGGQKFIPYVLPKISRLREMINRVNPSILIQVDGGIDAHNISDVRRAGADVFVAGSSVFGSKNPAAAIQELIRLGTMANA